jgi:L-ascorbate metabolism protein UlaG (beta-lactamase superfamily)
MEIVYFGDTCFRLRGREGVVVTDPVARKGGAASRLTGDVVTVSHPRDNVDVAAIVSGQPRIIAGPGEYEVSGIMIVGVATYHDAEHGKKRGKNTAYVVELDDVVVCHLGDLGHAPTSDQLSQLRNVDVLLVPVGGDDTIDAAQAVEVISLIEPRIIIPMHYKIGEAESALDPLDKFLREMGVTGAEPQPRATVSKASLPETPQVIVLDVR